MLLVLGVEAVVGLPGSQPVVLLDGGVGEKEGRRVEGRLGEVLVVGGVLLDAPDHGQVGLLAELVELGQGLGDHVAVAPVVAAAGDEPAKVDRVDLLECEGDVWNGKSFEEFNSAVIIRAGHWGFCSVVQKVASRPNSL